MMIENSYENQDNEAVAHLMYVQEVERPGVDDQSLYQRPERSGNFPIDLVLIAQTVGQHHPEPFGTYRVEPYERITDSEHGSVVERGVALEYVGCEDGLIELVTEIAAAGYGLPEVKEAFADPLRPEGSRRGYQAVLETALSISKDKNNPSR